MSKAFWQGFKEGYMKFFWPGIIVSSAFVLGVLLGNHGHPYEQCTRKGFTNAEDIGECIWLLNNQPALR
jgi:hypothetical protein